VEAHIVTASTLALQNLERCLAQAGVEVREMVAAPLATGEAVLTADEKDMGVVVADVGGGTTGLCIYTEGQPFYTNVLKVGGQHITNDLTVGLRVPFGASEDLKVRYGHALSSMVDPQEKIEVPGEGREVRSISRLRECEIIEDRVAEMFGMILNDVKKSGHDGLLPGGLVLTGGGAELPGIAELGREIVGLPVRVGSAQGVGGVVDAISTPAYACSVGLLRWGLSHQEEAGGTEETPPGRRLRDILESIFHKLSRMFGGSGG
jgi:cell division protein FtsA